MIEFGYAEYTNIIEIPVDERFRGRTHRRFYVADVYVYFFLKNFLVGVSVPFVTPDTFSSSRFWNKTSCHASRLKNHSMKWQRSLLLQEGVLMHI